MRSAVKIAGTYTAIILGAGFASGQELGNFFVRFGAMGLPGLAVAGVLFALVGWAVLELCRLRGIASYRQLAAYTLGKRFAAVMEAVVGLFLFVLMATMLAACGASVYEGFGIPEYVGVAALAALCFAAVMLGMDNMATINAVLAPVMVIGGVFIGLYTFFFGVSSAFAGIGESWIVSAVTYACYNTVTAITVLAAIGGAVSGPKTSAWGAFLGAGAMTVLGLCLALPLFVSTRAMAFQIPLLDIVSNYGAAVKAAYMVVLLAAIYTTAAANCAAFIEAALGVLPVNKAVLTAAALALAVVASRAGFSTFVSRIYPLFGLFGFIQAVMILRAFVRVKRAGGNRLPV